MAEVRNVDVWLQKKESETEVRSEIGNGMDANMEENKNKGRNEQVQSQWR